jgi:hypothetical protein
MDNIFYIDKTKFDLDIDHVLFIVICDFFLNCYGDNKFERTKNFDIACLVISHWRIGVFLQSEKIAKEREENFIYSQKMHDAIGEIFFVVKTNFELTSIRNPKHIGMMDFVLEFFTCDFSFKNENLLKRFLSDKINISEFDEKFDRGIPTLRNPISPPIEKIKFN